ncbi:MAG: TVP38/TMEM64 family protein [Planctomycetia bacterium]|nr:TVP38/TMEM64 family protein [Planctomycetia bacterium]
MPPIRTRWKVAAARALVAGAALAWGLSPAARGWLSTATSVLASGDVQRLKEWLLSYGAWAPVVSALLMIFQSVAAPLPAFVITFANGLLFGAWRGGLLSWSSAMAGAALCFYLARALGRPAVERLAGGRRALDVSDRFFARHGDRAVLVARLLPFVPFDIISYGAGLTSMGFWRFFIATGVGQIPATIVYSWLGQSMSGSVKAVFWSFACALALVVFVTILKAACRTEGDGAPDAPPPGAGDVAGGRQDSR